MVHINSSTIHDEPHPLRRREDSVSAAKATGGPWKMAELKWITIQQNQEPAFSPRQGVPFFPAEWEHRLAYFLS
jgi:hypothetical protein